MPQTKQLEEEEEDHWFDQYEQPADDYSDEIMPWDQPWAISGCITWRYNDIILLSVPFVYHPTPFLPGATTITNVCAVADPATSRGYRTAILPTLPPGDEWVMVDHYWRHELLGCMEPRDIPGKGDSHEPVGVSGTTIEVGNLLADPEDVDDMELLRYVYRHFRAAGLIRDLWLPVGQKGSDRLKVVVVFAEDGAIGRALAMPVKQYFVNDIAQNISVNHYYPVWYPAPQSQVAALEAYAVSIRTTSINALMWLDRDLAEMETDYSLPSIDLPACRPFSEMPQSDKAHIRMFFGFTTLEPISLSGTPMGGKRIPFPPPPPPPYSQDPPPGPVPSVAESTTKSDPSPPSPPPKPISASSIPPPTITIDRRGLSQTTFPEPKKSGSIRATPLLIMATASRRPTRPNTCPTSSRPRSISLKSSRRPSARKVVKAGDYISKEKRETTKRMMVLKLTPMVVTRWIWR